ncbi:hypothetical protein K1T73_15020 [Roseovarius sp. SCSIO 43702]|uniref:YhdP family protein n=1 Tax=Roseovarius sp. SCSIO 43702 TaxID=2823043 RepID=UPI001C734356|nr:AsmA-like C-terminal region-containing protein [Roseovarius sp. SCSIO 43702]QYX56349.1 hypothetical protein K1T73_15020 [Roseovarius sp. SCSIO 43702]
MAASDDKVETAEGRSRARRGGRGRKIGLLSLLSVSFLVLAGALLVLSYLGTPIVVPDWLHARIIERINEETGGVEVEMGEVVVVVEQGWQPRIELHDVAFSQRGGQPIAALAELSGTVALKPLLRGELQPKVIRVSGAALALRRDADGKINLALGGGMGDVQLAEVIARIDRAMTRPGLATLREVQADNITLRYEDARAGRAWNVDGGSLGLLREGEELRLGGDFTLLGARAYPTRLGMSFASRIGEAAAEVSVNIEDMPADEIAGQSPAMAWLGALEAPISGALRAQVDEDGRLGPLNATLQIGEGVLKPNDAVQPVAFTGARTYFTYDPRENALRFEDVSIDSKWGRVRAEGQAFLIGAETGWPTELQAQMRLRDIEMNPMDFYPEPVRLDAASMDMRLNLDPFELTVGELTLQDQGQRLVLAGTLRAVEAGWDLAVDAEMDALSHARLVELWPATVKANTRDWLVENIEKGQLSDIQLAVRSDPGEVPDAYINFAYHDLTTKFVKEMPPIREGAGQASLYGNRFAITATEGYVEPAQGGRIDIAGTSFIIPDAGIRRGPAVALVKIDSTITAALSLLNSDPVNLMDKAGQPVTLAEGRATLEGRLDFLLKPQLQTEEIVFDVKGRLRDLRSETLVEGRTLTAETLDLRADGEGLRVEGAARLGQVPFEGEFATPLTKQAEGGSRVTGTVILSQGFVDEFGIGLPPGSITGQAEGEITVDLRDGGAGDFVLNSDLRGLGMRLSQLNWSKPAASGGSLRVEGRLGQPPAIDRVALDAPGLEAVGAVTLRPDGVLDRAVFSRVNVGGWLDAPVTLVGRGPGATPAVQVSGGRVDLRRTSLSAGPGAATRKGAPVSLALDRLTISDGIMLTDFRAKLDTSGGTSGQFSGKVNNGAQVSGTILPEAGRSAFRIVSENAGGVLRSAGLLKNARGGSMELILRPATEAGSYNGRLKGANLWLTDAPAMAALLSAMSGVGLLEQMSGNGIHFAELDAQFKLSPEQLTLYKGRATGASMGVTMDGYYWLKEGRMDMQGVISPVYAVNAIGGILTRKGEGLIGFNYQMKGPAKDPRVKVLPLTLFTPGMFRNIFRRAPPGVQRAEDRLREIEEETGRSGVATGGPPGQR